MKIPATVLLFLWFACSQIPVTAATAAITPEKYHRTFSTTHPVLKQISAGETVVARTVCAAGRDDKGEQVTPGGNPLTGPFVVAGAEPGDALVVRFSKIRLTRPWGHTGARLGTFALTPEAIAAAQPMYSARFRPDTVFPGAANMMKWEVDDARRVVRLTDPKSERVALEFPAKPMIGCVGVAPLGEAPTSAPCGAYGGNLDYNEIGEGAAVLLPVYHAGAFLYLGDGHALQGDGEPTGSGIEISMEIEFTCEIRKNAKLTGPRVETADYIISIGSQPEFKSSLDQSLRMATSDMLSWLIDSYQLEPWAAHMIIGYAGKYDVITVAGSMGLKIPKKYLPR
jgi:amidase